jgi:hypothetical protein
MALAARKSSSSSRAMASFFRGNYGGCDIFHPASSSSSSAASVTPKKSLCLGSRVERPAEQVGDACHFRVSFMALRCHGLALSWPCAVISLRCRLAHRSRVTLGVRAGLEPEMLFWTVGRMSPPQAGVESVESALLVMNRGLSRASAARVVRSG